MNHFIGIKRRTRENKEERGEKKEKQLKKQKNVRKPLVLNFTEVN